MKKGLVHTVSACAKICLFWSDLATVYRVMGDLHAFELTSWNVSVSRFYLSNTSRSNEGLYLTVTMLLFFLVAHGPGLLTGAFQSVAKSEFKSMFLHHSIKLGILAHAQVLFSLLFR